MQYRVFHLDTRKFLEYVPWMRYAMFHLIQRSEDGVHWSSWVTKEELDKLDGKD